MTFEEADESCPEAVRIWSSGHLDAAAPQVENLRQLASRVQRFAARLQRHSGDEAILIAAPSGPLLVLLCTWLRIDLERFWQIRLDPSSVSQVETYPEGATLCFLNDTCQLMVHG
jgi:broad specificity phosphatase PhoE